MTLNLGFNMPNKYLHIDFKENLFMYTNNFEKLTMPFFSLLVLFSCGNISIIAKHKAVINLDSGWYVYFFIRKSTLSLMIDLLSTSDNPSKLWLFFFFLQRTNAFFDWSKCFSKFWTVMYVSNPVVEPLQLNVLDSNKIKC